MRKIPSPSVTSAWARLIRAQRVTLTAVEGRLKAAGFPPLAWYDVLWELEQAGPRGLRPFELERAVLLAQYNLSRLIDRLEAAGHVERRPCEEDSRGQVLAITPAGQALRRRMWPAYAEAIVDFVGRRLGEKEAARLAELLGKLARLEPSEA